jgi:hypothetical protein
MERTNYSRPGGPPFKTISSSLSADPAIGRKRKPQIGTPTDPSPALGSTQGEGPVVPLWPSVREGQGSHSPGSRSTLRETLGDWAQFRVDFQ